MIPNHYSAKLSALDLEMVRAVPPGGNWKDIPASIPSKRLDQIRASYAAGEGSRSTYYGRLTEEDPAYTINTYFSRPGNGCFIHYDVAGNQQRLLSQREAARLQSFPDSFAFKGSKAQVYKQIGNAVPPLLAYQIATSLSTTGEFVDLFSGAGGLSLGFHWAGWNGILANDTEETFLETYAANLNTSVIAGDISLASVRSSIVTSVRSARKQTSRKLLFVLGGPPCQGFSTAGSARSMSDKRNHLFRAYVEMLDQLGPAGFVFENVPGLLNMDGGRVFRLIKKSLAGAGYELQVWKLNAEEYGVPQRRTRIFIVGLKTSASAISAPERTTSFKTAQVDLLRPRVKKICGVKDAISDLPPLVAGQDGSDLSYVHVASTDYQRFVRQEISPADYLRSLGT